jgi:ClpP class serine protease
MSRVFQALTAEPWAIVPAELQKIAAIVQRHATPDAAKGEPEYQKRDYLLMAGPGAQRLAGTSRAFLVDGVAILPITGPIFPRANMMTEYSGATSINTLTDDYRKALDSSDVGAILLLVDSPGGAVSGINAFADIVATGAKKKYTTAFVAGAAASAAYWIASAASEIAMERTGMVGSIGVVAAIPVQVAPDAGGDLWIEIVSTNAPNKRPDPISEDGRSEIVATLDAVEKQFVADVARGRKTTARSPAVSSTRASARRRCGSTATRWCWRCSSPAASSSLNPGMAKSSPPASSRPAGSLRWPRASARFRVPSPSSRSIRKAGSICSACLLQMARPTNSAATRTPPNWA